jgi:hypothetical protein
MGGRADTEHSRWFDRLPHSPPQQLKLNLPVAGHRPPGCDVAHRPSASSTRAAVGGSRAYRKCVAGDRERWDVRHEAEDFLVFAHSTGCDLERFEHFMCHFFGPRRG